MPIYHLKIKAELENIEYLKKIPNNLWKFDVISTGGDTKEGVTVSEEDIIELDGSKGEANYIMKWTGSNQQAYIKIINNKSIQDIYTCDDSNRNTYVTILGLECRNLEISKWIPDIDFIAMGKSNGENDHDTTIFNEVDLSDLGDGWCDYDEHTNESVSITNLQYQIVKA